MNNETAKKETQRPPDAANPRGHSMASYFRRLIPVNAKASAVMTISRDEAEKLVLLGYTAASIGLCQKHHQHHQDAERKTYWLIGYGQWKKEQSSPPNKL